MDLYISLIGLICVSCRFSTRRISGRQRNLPRRPREKALIGRKARAIGGSSPTQNSPLRFLIGILYHEGFFFSIVKLPGNPFLRRGNPPLHSPPGKGRAPSPMYAFLPAENFPRRIDTTSEWCYSTDCFNNYGLLLDEIKAVLPADKILAVSPHKVSYAFDKKYMDNCDFFTFQIYGPDKGLFTLNSYKEAYDMFLRQGYPKGKMVLSYACTTSGGYLDGVRKTATIGVRDSLLEGDYTPDQNEGFDGTYMRYFTGFNQTYERSKFVRDNDLKGIFYWDMGNDVATNHKYSLVKASSFAINSNVARW